MTEFVQGLLVIGLLLFIILVGAFDFDGEHLRRDRAGRTRSVPLPRLEKRQVIENDFRTHLPECANQAGAELVSRNFSN